MGVRVVIVGGSFGGLTTAYELRRRLGPERAEITLVSRQRRFLFVPSLPWVALGSRTLDQISVDIAGPLGRRNVQFVHETLTGVDAAGKVVRTDRREWPYDFLVIATGHRSANEAVPGLGPFDGPGHSLMSAPEAAELGAAVRRLLADPGPVVVGAAPGASCIGPAYEFAFTLDHLLRRHRLRHAVPMTYVTPEPHLGHMGIGGIGKLRPFLEAEFEERDIAYSTSAALTKITDHEVEIDGHASLPAVLTMAIPPFGGVTAIADSPHLANPKGFVPVDDHYRHLDRDGVYAVGVAVALPPVAPTPVPVNFPKTGHMTEQMARIAAADIAARVDGREGESRPLAARCILDMGDRGTYMSVDPVRPPRNQVPKLADGRRWLLAKQAFERAYLWHVQHGRLMPTTLGW